MRGGRRWKWSTYKLAGDVGTGCAGCPSNSDHRSKLKKSSLGHCCGVSTIHYSPRKWTRIFYCRCCISLGGREWDFPCSLSAVGSSSSMTCDGEMTHTAVYRDLQVKSKLAPNKWCTRRAVCCVKKVKMMSTCTRAPFFLPVAMPPSFRGNYCCVGDTAVLVLELSREKGFVD